MVLQFATWPGAVDFRAAVAKSTDQTCTGPAKDVVEPGRSLTIHVVVNWTREEGLLVLGRRTMLQKPVFRLTSTLLEIDPYVYISIIISIYSLYNLNLHG